VASCFLRLLILGALSGMGAADATPFAYISNEGSNTVSVIDTATNAVVATVPVVTRGLHIVPFVRSLCSQRN